MSQTLEEPIQFGKYTLYERIGRGGMADVFKGRIQGPAGFERVFWAILDTHVASLIAAAFLFQFGTGPIRGFATTLSIGLMVNLFTSIFVSKTIYEMELSARKTPALSI